MKVVVHPADYGGCGRYRMEWPGEALRAQGHDVTVLHDWTYKCVWQDTIQGPTVIGIHDKVDADVIVMQRPLHRNRVELISAFQAQGIRVVVEIDDDFHAIHRKNPAWVKSTPTNDHDRNRDWLMRACKKADLVTVSTPALAARYGAHGRVVVLPNYVPEFYTRLTPGSYTRDHLPRPPGTLVGWSGSTLTHPDDLEATGGAMQSVVDGGARFHVVGTGLGVQDALSLTDEPTSTGWVPLEAYPEAVMQLDVGIVPLAAHAFNEAKSWLKGLEYASTGVPFVATPTEQYRGLAAMGIGYLADSPAAWAHLVGELARDPVHREACSLEWQEAAKDMTIEKHAWRWMEAWEQAVTAKVAA